MNATYKLLKSVADESLTNEDMQNLYPVNINRDTIIASMFVNNFALWKQVTSRFSDTIDESDLASIVLSCIYTGFEKFDSTKKCSILTYIALCIKSECINECIRRKKRAMENLTDDVHIYHMDDEKNDKGTGHTEVQYIENDYSKVELLSCIERSNLYKTEKLVCKAIIEYYPDTIEDMAKRVNMSRPNFVRVIQKIKNSDTALFNALRRR